MIELSVNGITLRYEVRGHGDPLILLHGDGEDHIASCIRGARELIVKRATHTSCVVHSNRLAEIILQFTGKNGRT